MRVLFLSPWYPYPQNNGSKIRIYNLLKSLARKNEIHLISFVRPAEQVDPSGLKGICESIETIPWKDFHPLRLKALVGFLNSKPRSVADTYSVEMESCVKHICQQTQPDLMICSEFGTAIYAPPPNELPAIFEDIELSIYWDAWTKSRRFPNRFRRRLTWLKTRRYIRQLLRNFNACTVVSKAELDLVASIAPNHQDIYLIPNGVDLEEFQPDSEQPVENTLIYNGALTYSANLDAMKFFLEQIFPQVKSQIPDVFLSITGSYQGVDTSGLCIDDTVKLTSFLPDIRPAIAKSWTVVVPLRTGGGTRLKILEAMALGTPVISTTKGAEGLEVTPEKNILLADDPANFARQTIRLLQDSNLRSSLSINGRKLVEAKYGWNEIGEQFLQLVENTAQKGI
jgi:glycosyltransferase involved in cell wall biosynthesis